MRILVAEDDPSIGAALTAVFGGQGHAVNLAGDGGMADQALRDESFDLVILDLGLPQLDGFEVLRRLRERKHSIPVLILSANGTLDNRVRGLDLGADDFVCKPFSLAELRARVAALMRRTADALEAPPAPARYDAQSRMLYVNGLPLALTARETAMIEVLWRNFGRIVTKEQLIEHAYDFSVDISVNAIEVCVHRIRRKLENAPFTLRTVAGVGYTLEQKLH